MLRCPWTNKTKPNRMGEMSCRVGWGDSLEDWSPDWSLDALGGEFGSWDCALVEDDFCCREWLEGGPLTLFESVAIKPEAVACFEPLDLRTDDDANDISASWMDTKVDITEYVFDEADTFGSLPTIDGVEEVTCGEADQTPDQQSSERPTTYLEESRRSDEPGRLMYSSALLHELLKPLNTSARSPAQNEIVETTLAPVSPEHDDDLMWILQNADESSTSCLLITGDDLATEEVTTDNIDDESLESSLNQSSLSSCANSSDDDDDSSDGNWKSPASKRKRPHSQPYPRKRGAVAKTHRDRKLRKKEQNKNAATRYREKKKAEEMMNEILCDDLEKRNRELRDQAEDMAQEIKVLKELIVDIFQRPSTN